ncbi:hypothetical protein [Paracoccus yeei]|uniref:hypothetical protein n=1 Tax=Paracoccus yeei TaxID=147645 RepID=UPI001180649A|nr:hypothetical protein [Paracoccus yeei]
MLADDRDQPIPGALPESVPERLHLTQVRSATDLLWSAEEALRMQAVGLIIAAPRKPISLTVGRGFSSHPRRAKPAV